MENTVTFSLQKFSYTSPSQGWARVGKIPYCIQMLIAVTGILIQKILVTQTTFLLLDKNGLAGYLLENLSELKPCVSGILSQIGKVAWLHRKSHKLRQLIPEKFSKNVGCCTSMHFSCPIILIKAQYQLFPWISSLVTSRKNLWKIHLVK